MVLGKGKKLYDKKKTLKERDIDRDVMRQIK
jgi:tmRNA-binding protein